MSAFTVVSSPIQPHLQSIFSNCRSNLFIASPFIKKSAIEWLVKTKPSSLKNVSVLTNISISSITAKSLDVDALRLIFDTFYTASIVSLPSLHAKVFVIDHETAFITSANFTNGGLWTNYEYGIIVSDQLVIQKIVQDMTAYMSLGSVVSLEFLNSIEQKAIELGAIEKQIEASPTTKVLRQKARQAQTDLQTVLLSHRLREGTTINELFSKTILMLLHRQSEGMATPQLHEEIRNTHPDICDDSIDRIINGQHFGKRWKHYVRRAQEFLKNKGLIANHGGIWVLA
jgi:hypothetical protein